MLTEIAWLRIPLPRWCAYFRTSGWLAVAKELTASDPAEFPGQHPMPSEAIAKAARGVF